MRNARVTIVFLLTAVCVCLSVVSARALPVRTSDSLWFSGNSSDGAPLSTIDLHPGTTTTIYLWLEVAPGSGYDVGGMYFPIFYSAPNETKIRVGASGSGRWPGGTGSVSGIPIDASYGAFAPFSGWNVRALYDRSHASIGDSSDVLVSFARYGASGSGWLGRAPVAQFNLTGVATGTYTLTTGRHVLSGGLRTGPSLSNGAGNRVWVPVVVPLTVKVDTSTTAVPPSNPREFALLPPAPSPTTGEAVVAFTVPRTARVSLSVLDTQGRVIRRVLNHRRFTPGAYRETFDLSGAPGIYFCRMVVDGGPGGEPAYVSVRSLVVIR
jgi:hypothetical protein